MNGQPRVLLAIVCASMLFVTVARGQQQQQPAASGTALVASRGSVDPNLRRAANETSPSATPATVDLQERPLTAIPPGTVINGDKPPKGWSNLVLFAIPRIGAGDVSAVPRTAAKYSGMFHFTILANVRAEAGGEPKRYYLEKVAMGTAIDVRGRKIIATPEQNFGAELGFIGKKVFEENEKMLRSGVRQVTRTRTMLIFDGQGFVVHEGKHQAMVIRHVVMVSPRDGQLATFMWLLSPNGSDAYQLAESSLQLLPNALIEDRVLSVDGSKFTLGIPSNDAFALAHITQGLPVKFTPKLIELAPTRQFTAENTHQLEADLQTRYVPLLSRANAETKVKR